MFYDTSFYRYTVENRSLFSLALEKNTADVMSTGYIDTKDMCSLQVSPRYLLVTKEATALFRGHLANRP